MPTKIIMPQLGESVVEGTVTKWLKQEGERIDEMESLLEVNTDKVDTEIPSPAGGTLLKIVVPEGETVKAGTVIAWVGAPGEEVPGGTGVPGGGGAPAGRTAAEPEERAPEVAEPGAGKSAEAIQETVEQPDPSEAQGATQPISAQTQPVPAQAGRSRELGFISPVVARIAQENQIDLTQVRGTGDGGRITKKDVLAYLETKAPAEKTQAVETMPWETPADGDLFRPTEMVFAKGKPAQTEQKLSQPVQQTQPVEKQAQPAASQVSLPGDGQIVPLTNMRRRIAEHMVMSKRTSPHVTTVMEADLHRTLAHFNANKDAFARDGARLTYTAYFVAATVQALRAFPMVNSSWSDEGIRLHKQVNIGLAVSLGEEGLIVPVIKNADDLSLMGLARAISDVAGRARAHKLQAADVQGGTFSITNHGISGSLFATPVINHPQCGILGVGAIQKRVVVVDAGGGDTIAIRPMMYLSLTFDHRILDGASADGFLAKIVETLENWA